MGFLEAMFLVIRSRMWLFPGIIHPLSEVKRSDLERNRRAQVNM